MALSVSRPIHVFFELLFGLLLGFVPFGSNLGIFGRLAGLFLLALL